MDVAMINVLIQKKHSELFVIGTRVFYRAEAEINIKLL